MGTRAFKVGFQRRLHRKDQAAEIAELYFIPIRLSQRGVSGPVSRAGIGGNEARDRLPDVNNPGAQYASRLDVPTLQGKHDVLRRLELDFVRLSVRVDGHHDPIAPAGMCILCTSTARFRMTSVKFWIVSGVSIYVPVAWL